jgi:hypothetical protein
MKDWTIMEWVKFIEAISLILGLGFGCYQMYDQSKNFKIQSEALHETRKINSATFVLKISDELSNSKYDNLRKAIDEHKRNYTILNRFSKVLVNDYLGNFEAIGNLKIDKIINGDMAYSELGYQIEKTWCNQDVNKYIKNNVFIKLTRNLDQNSSDSTVYNGFGNYSGLKNLTIYCLSKDNIQCSDLDEK